MAAESNARSLDESDISIRMDLGGLDEIFHEHEELFARGLSIKEAVYYYGETRKSLRAKVEDGTIPAIRMPEEQGKKWRVFPAGVPEQLEYLIPKKLRKKKERNEIDEIADEIIESSKADPAVGVAIDLTDPLKSDLDPGELTEPPVPDFAPLDFSVSEEQSIQTEEAPAQSEYDYESVSLEQIIAEPIRFEYECASAVLAALLEPASDSGTIDCNPSAPESTVVEETVYEAPSRQSVLDSVTTDTAPATAHADPSFAYPETGEDPAGYELPPLPPIDFELPVMEQTSSDYAEVPEIARTVFRMDDTALNSWKPYLGSSQLMNFAPHSDFEIFAQMPAAAPIAAEAEPAPAENELSVKYELMQEKLEALEGQLAKTMMRNDYLETKLQCLEDQIKFLTQSHYHSRGFNKLLLLIPAAALIAAIFIFRFGTINLPQ